MRPTQIREAASFRRLAALATGLIGLPSVAFAAEGMPQLAFNNPLTISQVVWGAIIFLVLYLVFSRSALPGVTAVLKTREAAIKSDLDAAYQAKARADAAVNELTDATAKARSDAQAAINKAVDQAKQESAERARILNERLDEQLRTAEQQIAAARSSAMGALRQVATETATVVVNRLTGMVPDQQTIDGAVGATLAARGQG